MADATARLERPLAARRGLAAWLVAALAVLAVVALTGLVYAQWLATTVQWDPDEGILLVWGQLLGRGFRLYTDIWCDQPPGVPLSLAAGFRLFGETVEGGRLVILLYGLLGMLGAGLLAALLSLDVRLDRTLPTVTLSGAKGLLWRRWQRKPLPPFGVTAQGSEQHSPILRYDQGDSHAENAMSPSTSDEAKTPPTVMPSGARHLLWQRFQRKPLTPFGVTAESSEQRSEASPLGRSAEETPHFVQGDGRQPLMFWTALVAALAAMIGLALSPNFFVLARSVSHDIPPISVGMCAVALGLLYKQTARRAWLVGAGALAAWGMALKLTAALPAALLVALVAVALPRRGWLGEALRAGLSLVVGAALVLVPLLLTTDLGGLMAQALATPLSARDAWDLRFADTSRWILDYVFTENRALAALALLGAAALLVSRSLTGAVVTLYLLLTALALTQQRPLFPSHHLVILLFPLAALAGVGVAAVAVMVRAPRATRSWQAAAVVVALVVLLQLPHQADALRGSVTSVEYQSIEKPARWLTENTPPDGFVLTDPPMVAFRAGRLDLPWLVDQSRKRFNTGQLSAEIVIAELEKRPVQAVVFWSSKIDTLDPAVDWMRRHYVIVDRVGERTFWLPMQPGLVQNERSARVGDFGELLGYNVEQGGNEIEVVLFWRALAETSANYLVTVRLLDANGQEISRDESAPDRGRTPTTEWQPGAYVGDRHRLPMKTFPPGVHRLEVSLRDKGSGARVPFTDGAGRPLGATLELGAIELTGG